MQVEPIINARFRKFRESHELLDMKDGIAFERFVNYAILSGHHPGAFSADSELLETVSIGGSADMGIDGIAIKINGLLIKSKSEIDDIVKGHKRVNVEFIFIQSKYKPKFNKGELNNFFTGVRDFLSDAHDFPMNDNVRLFLDLKEYILSDDIMIMWDSNPVVTLYYVAMGRWRDAPDLVGLSKQFVRDLEQLNIYENSTPHFIDSDALKDIYDSIENTFSATINTRHTMPLTDVKDVSNSCIAIVYSDEFLRLLTTGDGVIRKSLFNNNVRDYQGDNPVNKEIEDTISNNPSEFIVFNNGVTVVCDEFKQNNTRLTINNPQIVNGCQTSHVVFNAFKKNLDISKVPLTIKFISTKNPELSNQIVRGTNRQNIVLEEAFEATKEFHKKLEEFFIAISSDYEPIYYERRAKQYSDNPTIKQTQKFSLKLITQYFIGMFLNKPHVSHRHESVLLKEYANDIFQDFHSMLPYYTAALSFYKMEKLFRDALVVKYVKPYKAHLLMMLRESIAGCIPNLTKEKHIDNHSEKILAFISNPEKLLSRITELVSIFDQSKENWTTVLNKNPYRMKDQTAFTKVLLEQVRKEYDVTCDPISKNTQLIGKVVKIAIDRNGERFGFIFRQPEDIFFHSLQNSGVDFNELEGKIVTYDITQNDNGKPFAINVKVKV